MEPEEQKMKVCPACDEGIMQSGIPCFYCNATGKVSDEQWHKMLFGDGEIQDPCTMVRDCSECCHTFCPY